MEVPQFEVMVRSQCTETKNILKTELVTHAVAWQRLMIPHCFFLPLFRWIAECGELFRTYKSTWAHLIPTNPDFTPVLAEHFFNCASSLMSRHLRETVENSLKNFLAFLSYYKDGNNYAGEFFDLKFPKKPVSRLRGKKNQIVYLISFFVVDFPH